MKARCDPSLHVVIHSRRRQYATAAPGMRIFIARIKQTLEDAKAPIPRAFPASPILAIKCRHGSQVRTTLSRANGSPWRSVAGRISSSCATAAAGNIISPKHSSPTNCIRSISPVTGLPRSPGLRRKCRQRRSDRSRRPRARRLRSSHSLERDDFSSNCHPALAYWWSMICSDIPSPADPPTLASRATEGLSSPKRGARRWKRASRRRETGVHFSGSCSSGGSGLDSGFGAGASLNCCG